MQFTTFAATFALLSLAAAAPAASVEERAVKATVRVALSGLSELQIQREIPNNGQAGAAPGKFTDAVIQNLNGNAGITCQAYSDAAATKKVGGRFGTTSIKLNGGKEVTVAVVKCAKGAAKREAEAEVEIEEREAEAEAEPIAEPITVPELETRAAKATIRVALSGLSELQIQREIPNNNVAGAAPGKFTDAVIQNLNGNNGFTCQAYSDAAATKKVGGRFGTTSIKLNGGKEVTVAVVKCSK
ncbi:hypothetical protein BGZ60DRAFT_419816 [Tricladium varicosporioides]|nr:hypothetical protein BGZ60DRAFT_419816 [Hymenoscyphus varicosporioides]